MAAALRPRLLVLLAVAAAATGPSCAGAGRVDLWPMPASVARGAQTLLVSKDLRLSTAGSSYPDGKGILTEAFRRMVAVVELDHAINGTYSRGAPVLAGVHVAVRSPNDEVGVGSGHRQSHRLDWILVEWSWSHAMGTQAPPAAALRSLRLVVLIDCSSSSLLQLNFGVDESYRLSVPATGDPLYAQIEVSVASCP
jgi:hypothetical protein